MKIIVLKFGGTSVGTLRKITKVAKVIASYAKKKYKVRMAPTIIIFKDGVKEEVWKAGLDLQLPTNLKEIQETINEINNASKF